MAGEPSRITLGKKLQKLRRSLTNHNETYTAPDAVIPPTDTNGFIVDARMIRYLREQILLRYTLDMQIWNKGRKAKTFMRESFTKKLTKSDAVLADIEYMLHNWDNRDYFEDDEAYGTFSEVKARVESTGKRNWNRHPPWESQTREEDHWGEYARRTGPTGVKNRGQRNGIGGWDERDVMDRYG